MDSKTNFLGIDSLSDMTKAAVVAALYVVLTAAFAPLSFGAVQFRFAEGFNVLSIFNKRYIVAVTLGCFIANLISTVGPIDLVAGTFETFINLITIYFGTKLIKSMAGKMVFSVISSTFYMFIIAWEIAIVGSTAFWPTFWSAYLTCAVGEFVTVALGAIIFYFVNQHYDLSK